SRRLFCDVMCGAAQFWPLLEGADGLEWVILDAFGRGPPVHVISVALEKAGAESGLRRTSRRCYVVIASEARSSIPGMPMRRREFIALLGGAAAGARPVAARAQEPHAGQRNGWLSTTAEQDPQRQAFHQEFAKLGWTDGDNFRIDHRSTSGEDDSRARTLAMEIVTGAPDVILTTGTQLTAIMKQQTSTIPIVFV